MKTLNILCVHTFMVAMLCIAHPLLAEDGASLFYIDEAPLNQVEDILLETTISEVTDALSVGHLNISALEKLSPGDSLYLSLPDYGSEVRLVMDLIDSPLDTAITYSGTVESYEQSQFILSRKANKMLGAIKFGGMVYVIEPTSANDNRHVIHRMNTALLKRDHETDMITDPVETIKKLSSHQNPNLIPEKTVNRTQLRGQSSNGEVRVLFLYANNVTQADMTAFYILREFNLALKRSNVSNNNSIVAAGPAQLINSNFNNLSRRNILGQMKNRADVFNDIDLRMRSVAADVAFLITESNISDPVGGVAEPFDPNNPFAMSVKSYVFGDLTATHELGHVFGGAHALPLLPDEVDSPDPRGHGLEDSSGNWQTIMGGYTQNCVFDFSAGPNNQPCTRLGYFSNPDLAPSESGGQTIGNPQTANMKSVLESLMPQISNWSNEQPVNYSEAVRGFSFDAAKIGHGLHISQSGSSYFLYFYTFDASGRPEWFFGSSDFSNNRLQGSLSRINFNGPGDTDLTTVGSFSLDYSLPEVNNLAACDGVNRNRQPGVFNWTISGQTGSWCMQPLFVNNDLPVLLDADSGLWYEPAFPGWGFSTQAARVGPNQKGTYAVVFYYDANGQPRWAAGQSRINLSSNQFDYPNLMHFTGYPRNGTGVVTAEDIGDLNLNFGNNTATVLANYPVAPGGQWSRNNVAISRLAQ